MYVEQLWRYAVKSMRGESLSQARIEADGIAGDRRVHVEDDRGPVTARRHRALLGLTATTDPEGTVLVDGHPWHTPQVADLVRGAVGPDARLVAFDGPERFDVLPLLVATDGAVSAFGRDGRRLRPNIVVGGVEGLAERTWEGRVMAIGPVIVHLDSLRQRCVMTTFDPDTLVRDGEVLRDIHRRFGGTLALNTAVLLPGSVRVGDPVRLLTPTETSELAGVLGGRTAG
ncbi:MOSC domain-containing protein [Kineosporia sp. A_224]|uniref:MOSC domain-containing protein n=1 Tax=Kineosporia sp. A_224 TaxID=1962180 RepID=UPI000B4B3CFE|nr:MOSC N-terminal beta barrel domain-containing protein [Kineosporia sp. A_224]